jgi:hypothetical protein
VAEPDIIKTRGLRFNKFKAAQFFYYRLHSSGGSGGIALINLCATRVIDYYHYLPPSAAITASGEFHANYTV